MPKNSKSKLKTELIDRVLELVRQRLDEDRAEPAERFVRQFYRYVPPDDILAESPHDLFGAALTLWGLAEQRDLGIPKVRVSNPRSESHGWRSAHTIVEIVNDDMPFLVDSAVAALQELESVVHLVIHPVLRVVRDDDGRLVELLENGGDRTKGRPESMMHLQISEQPAEVHGAIAERLLEVLGDVRAAVEDWPKMQQQCRELIADLRAEPPPLPEEEIAEGIAFLEWIGGDHFTFLGFREYRFEGEGVDEMARVLPQRGLGILRDEAVTIFDKVRRLAPMPEQARGFLRRPELLIISKANLRSTVHRPVHLDALAVKTFDAQGRVVGQRVFVGLFTSTAYSASNRNIPLLRRKVAKVIAASGFLPRSHDSKALLHVLESYPRDELFQITEERLVEIAMGIVALQERQRTALFTRRDPFQRFVSCLVYVPRDRYDTALRLKFRDILTAAFHGDLAAFYTHVTDSTLARLHFILKTRPEESLDVDEADVERQLVAATRSWTDRLQAALVDEYGEEQGLATLRRFARAFPSGYQDHTNEHTAAFDIACIERCLTTGRPELNLYRAPEARPDEARLKVYVCGPPAPLSSVLPMLENMGLVVVDEVPHAIRIAERDDPVWIRDFSLQLRDAKATDLEEIRGTFHEALGLVWLGAMENDGFNRLVLSARLAAREVTILRAYCKYLLQVRIPFSQAYMEETLARNPEIVRLLVQLFQHSFDPDRPRDPARAEQLTNEIERRLEAVTHPDEDRIIRRFRNALRATLRTNYYQTTVSGDPKPYLSLKIDSRKILRLPKPAPYCEIFVTSPRVEAIHLRGGLVARGGIRWSERREDFRTEVLGLMKAQMVKNAVIVPVGSKGGFVVKRPPAGTRDEMMAEVVDCYKTMIRGILDLTDNLVGGEVKPPPRVVRDADRDDFYLVVAADKGTASFSDIANELSAEYGFWLDDAFASGGSAGYDHKKMAITSRGAWESVKRHFRELGKDVQQEPFTVVGVGDMAGDVFGNGMLQSEHIRLLGAFNHLHVFFDPDPDPAASFAERRRLFEKPGSSWADYDSALISEGGGIFERSQKTIPVTPRMAEMFGIEDEKVAPSELIRAMLKHEVELLWFGGIGTFVKASHEAHSETRDRTNDAVRVSADEVRAKVIAEGANLAITQTGRVELGQLGVRLNTDFIDNSAGVDCSDHEVNIKILLREVETAGDITRKQRDELLREMTEEVAQLVLRDNYLQTQAISVTHSLGARLADRTARLVRRLEKNGRLDRQIESLPDDETLAERLQQRVGFSRPEIAVLLSYAKMDLYDQLLDSDLPEDPYLVEELRRYFPNALPERFPEAITRHRLRREITATSVTNNIVNRVGITFLHEVEERTGRPASAVARAYLIGREIFRFPDLWRRIEALDNRTPARLQCSMLAECGRLLERATVWFLREEAQPLDVASQIERYHDGIQELAKSLASLVSLPDRELLDERIAGFLDHGVPEPEATLIASLPVLAAACDIVRIGRDLQVPVERVGEVYFGVGARFGFDWLRAAAAQLPAETAWDKLAVTAMVDDLFGHQSDLARRIVGACEPSEPCAAAIERWAASRRAMWSRTEQLLAELQALAKPNLAMLAVANRRLKSMSL